MTTVLLLMMSPVRMPMLIQALGRTPEGAEEPRTRGNGTGSWFKLNWEMALVEDIALVQMV
jgi:hypothetical protein